MSVKIDTFGVKSKSSIMQGETNQSIMREDSREGFKTLPQQETSAIY
jgi:hypothetical protein